MFNDSFTKCLGGLCVSFCVNGSNGLFGCIRMGEITSTHSDTRVKHDGLKENVRLCVKGYIYLIVETWRH